ncbi:hypothetical protein LMF32_00810 [Desemzia sp. C1]|uniref:hypothetical protein n=1 Tax=Desemzia sp. C1 TaxID=2892016 RepID=UPI001E39E406|nr:hypothetical protein [Desemzia sp. C1]MCI3027676.1 hypothetical protein [Desemzia sp. C1]
MVAKSEFNDRVNAVEPEKASVLVVAIKLPTGALEIITNYQNIPEKIKYYQENYNENMRLKHAPDVQIVNFMIV